MLKIEIKSLLRARGFKTTHVLLKKMGIPHSTAMYILAGNATSIKLVYLERLCELLHCTPNDLLTWEPNLKDPQQIRSLQALRKPNTATNVLLPIIQNLDFEEMDEAVQLLTEWNEKKKKEK